LRGERGSFFVEVGDRNRYRRSLGDVAGAGFEAGERGEAELGADPVEEGG
jgi:hypothetical protein